VKMNTLYFEVPIMLIGLMNLTITLNNIYMQSRGTVQVETKKTMFALSFISSSLGIILGIINKQWFILLSASNYILQITCILYLINTMQRKPDAKCLERNQLIRKLNA